MCARFITKKGELVARRFNGRRVSPDASNEQVVPRRPGPEIVKEAASRLLDGMAFCLLPAWRLEGGGWRGALSGKN